jgi:hypothetical protein
LLAQNAAVAHIVRQIAVGIEVVRDAHPFLAGSFVIDRPLYGTGTPLLYNGYLRIDAVAGAAVLFLADPGYRSPI